MAEARPDEQRRLSEELGAALYRHIDAGATAIVFQYSEIGPGSGGKASAYTTGGDRLAVSLADEVLDLAESLRAAMYRPGAGTWYSAKITVTSAGSMDADFDYDHEPEWDEGIPTHWFVADLERFPRDESARPDWLKRAIAESTAN